MTPREPIKRILALTRSQWDVPSARRGVRESFAKVLDCRTPKLGAEVYASAPEEKVFFHTCKSRACPSCGNRGTLLWQREQWVTLPDVPFVGIVLTMPDVFWPIFKDHRDLQQDLTALGAAAIPQWAKDRFGVALFVTAIQHTFGGRLNHNPHLHMLVSAGGLRMTKSEWVPSLRFHREEIMNLWRLAVTSYLESALRKGLLSLPSASRMSTELIRDQAQRSWNIQVTAQMSKKHFLGYAGRYIRRLPVAQRRILSVSAEEVVYESKVTRTKTHAVESCTPAEFVEKLAQHIPDRYRNSMRYFGLLAPRTKATTRNVVFCLLGQQKRPKPKREPWAHSIRKQFGTDPLSDSKGCRMQWVSSLKPRLVAQTEAHGRVIDFPRDQGTRSAPGCAFNVPRCVGFASQEA